MWIPRFRALTDWVGGGSKRGGGWNRRLVSVPENPQGAGTGSGRCRLTKGTYCVRFVGYRWGRRPREDVRDGGPG